MSNYFEEEEFACRCGRPDCDAAEMDRDHVARLNRARKISGVPYYITSGRRCAVQNQLVGGSPSSAHLTGHADDIQAATSRQRYEILRGLIQSGFTRLGIGKDFLHADDDPALPPRVVWLYG